MSLQEFPNASSQCCWVENGVRCLHHPHSGSPKSSACEKHMHQHIKTHRAPGQTGSEEDNAQ